MAVTAIVAAFVYFATFERNASYGEVAEHDPDAKSWFTQALNRYLLRAAAELGDADAQFELALLYNHGEGVTEDQQQAMLWYRKAAEQGLADAQLRLGRMLASDAGAADDYEANLWLHQTDAMDIVRDWGAADDDEEAVMWVRKAAAQGLACAQVYLGQAYNVGVDGVLEQDSQQALLWQRRAAEQGLAFAQWQLGYQYGRGSHGVAKDYQQAALWYRKAAEQGLALAQNSLGLLYMRGSFEADSDGRSVAEDDQQQAMLWYRKAAEQGYAFAQYNLGEMYHRGEGVGVKAYPQAALWYRRAAEQGHPGAQLLLGAMYADGLGLPKDAVKSYAWASVAAAQGNVFIESPAGQVRDRIGETMTPSQIAEAQRLGRELAAEIEAAKPIRPTIGGSCG